jgi:hypothetical protein
MTLFRKKKVTLNVSVEYSNIEKFVRLIKIVGSPSIKLDEYGDRMRAEIDFENETEQRLFSILLVDGKVGDILK